MLYRLFAFSCCITNRLMCCSSCSIKKRRGANVKREYSLQGDSSFNDLKNKLSLPLPKLQKSKWRCSAGSAFISV